MGKKEKLREQPAGLPGGVDVPKAVAPRDAAPDAVPPHETPPMTRPPSWPRCVDAHSHARGSPSVSYLFIVLIEFGKYLFKHLARAPSLWGTPVAYARSHQELPTAQGRSVHWFKTISSLCFIWTVIVAVCPQGRWHFLLRSLFVLIPSGRFATSDHAVFISRSSISSLCTPCKALF